jgi:hypothetical protein
MFHIARLRAFTVCACLLLTACTAPALPGANAGATSTVAPPATTPATAATVPPAQGNQLRLTLDGKPWQADRDFFGAFHPHGMDRAVLMAASLGPKDEHEQAFNLNLFGVAGPGRYTASGNTLSLEGIGSSQIQLANLSEQRYLIGGPFGYTVEVELLQAGGGTIEARFQGRMTASDGQELRVSDGYFFYRE